MRKFAPPATAFIAAAVAALVTSHAFGEAVPAPAPPQPARPAPIPRPTLVQSLKALETAAANARSAGVALSCAIVDVRGDLVALTRMDDAPFLTASIAQGKALASALFGRPSGEFGAMASSPFFTSLNASMQNRLVPAQGAVPIVHEGRVIGAIGCSGGAPAQDETAAKAGAAAL